MVVVLDATAGTGHEAAQGVAMPTGSLGDELVVLGASVVAVATAARRRARRAREGGEVGLEARRWCCMKGRCTRAGGCTRKRSEQRRRLTIAHCSERGRWSGRGLSGGASGVGVGGGGVRVGVGGVAADGGGTCGVVRVRRVDVHVRKLGALGVEPEQWRGRLLVMELVVEILRRRSGPVSSLRGNIRKRSERNVLVLSGGRGRGGLPARVGSPSDEQCWSIRPEVEGWVGDGGRHEEWEC